MSPVNWKDVHDKDKSWRTKLIGDLSYDYVMPRYVELFSKFLRKSGKYSFLELGAGTGEMAELIASQNFEFISRYAVSEYFAEGVEWLKGRGLEAHLVDAENIPFENESFDAVLCFDVMHHVQNPSKMAKEMLRTARGRLFLTESNGLSFGRKLMELTPGHRKAGEKSFTPSKYRSFFDHPEFKITHFEIHPFVFPLYLPSVFSKITKYFNKLIEHIPLLNWQCSNVYMYIEYERTNSSNEWHEVYRSSVLSEKRKSSHLGKLKKLGIFSESKDGHLLDVCTGEGEMLDILKEEGFSSLIGIDLFRKKCDSIDEKSKYVQGSALLLPFKNESYDYVLCAHSLHHLSTGENIKSFLKEAYRTLKPGGKLFIIDHYDSWQLRFVFWLIESPIGKILKWTKAFRDQLIMEHTELYHYLNRWEEIRVFLKKSGFSKISFKNRLFFFYFVGKK